VKNLIVFLKYEVATVVEVTHEQESDFPTVSLCIIQACDLKDYTYRPYFEMSLNQTRNMSNVNLSVIAQHTYENFLKYYNKTELLKATGNTKGYNQNVSIIDYLISCHFSSKNCSEQDFVYFQVSEFQKCFKFNSGQDKFGNDALIKKVTRYGKNYGLDLQLFVNLQDNCKSTLTNSFGVYLYVHNNTISITEDSNSVQLGVGLETSVAVDRTFVSR
jgi:hypothetical protein